MFQFYSNDVKVFFKVIEDKKMNRRNRNAVFFILSFIFATMFLTGCKTSSKDYSKLIKDSIENKYNISDIEVMEYEQGKDGSPVPFSSEYDGTYTAVLKDGEGNIFHSFSETTADGSIHTYDDYEYNKVLNDVIDKYDLPKDCKITISYNQKRFKVRNMLDELYDGDLSKVEPVKVRIDYVDEDIKGVDFKDIAYILVSYESREALDSWYVDEWWSMPDQPPVGVKQIKTNGEYKEVYSTSIGSYILTSFEPIEVSESDDFNSEGVIGHGMTSAREISDPIKVSAKDHIKVAWKPDKEYTKEEVQGIRLGYKFYYEKNDEYCYGTKAVYMQNGYLLADCLKKEVDIVFLY